MTPSSDQMPVIENDICKKLCLQLFPEVSSAALAIEVNGLIQPTTFGSGVSVAIVNAKRSHIVYAILAQGLSTELREDCISRAISATSTDNYAVEHIHHTLNPNDRTEHEGHTYWCSEGESDVRVPEKLTYTLISDLCFITEINIQPFKAYFQQGYPIYSAKAVRFRLGYPKSPSNVKYLDAVMDAVHNDIWYDWTYVSPEFAMTQENCLQRFKLPEPVLCIGGILQIELWDRVQMQASDGLYYICVQHVQVVGRTLSSEFDVKSDRPGRCVVSYCPSARIEQDARDMC